MKAARLMMFVLCAVLVVGSSVLAAGLKLGDTAPLSAIKMKNVDGREMSIADVKGPNGMLVIFSCNHCLFVKAWESRISTIGNATQKRGIGVIAIKRHGTADVRSLPLSFCWPSPTKTEVLNCEKTKIPNKKIMDNDL